MGAALVAAWAFGGASPSFAQTNAGTHSPAKVVEKYFALDNKGVRLDAASFDALASFIDWKEEPTWGKIVVIDGFTVPDDFRKWDIVDKMEVVVPVEFRVLGYLYLETAGFVPEPSTEEVRVRLKLQGARWKIMEPVLPPHVGQKRMLNFVRQSILDERDETRRAALTTLQQELRKAKE
ncbi:MAG: hypothetical protein U0173_09125 [Nitrospiraceae bacterium]